MLDFFETIPALPVDTSDASTSRPSTGRHRSDQWDRRRPRTPGHNVELLAPEPVVQEMYTGFQEVIDGSKSAEDEAAALQAAFEASH